jgi:DNA-binding beta-propeller fold protein YncE
MSSRRSLPVWLSSLLLCAAAASAADAPDTLEGERLPTGARITPTAAPGASFTPLNPDLPSRPAFTAGQAVTAALGPDGRTLLVLTSGYNRNVGPTGQAVPAESNEYVFVYDVSSHPPVKRQALQLRNTFSGLAWSPDGAAFYVTGGVDDNVHVFRQTGGVWAEDGTPIPLGHGAGAGLGVTSMAAGIAVNRSGTHALVANFEHDSVTLVDLVARAAVAELDLRPGKINPAHSGQPGGGYPYWVAFKGDGKAYVSAQRDREVVVLGVEGASLSVRERIGLDGVPNRMILDRAQSRLYVACDNSDSVVVVDTVRDEVLEEIPTTAPRAQFRNRQELKGANPNSLALSRQERTLFVTNGGTNSVAVIRLREDDDDGPEDHRSEVVGLIPTGWYPNSIALSADGARFFVVNGKSNAGPNPGACRDTLSIAPGSLNPCRARNAYVWQLTKAGFLAAPVPSSRELARLTRQVARNNRFPGSDRDKDDRETMEWLRKRIDHVIYVVKENRTYDQVLGDLEVGNGDPSLTLFPEPITPNHHALARNFVVLDNFMDSGEVSGDGWNWTTAGRATDFTEKTVTVNYGGRGLSYDWEGTNRNVNVGLATVAERVAANPLSPTDPDILPGTADAAAPDAPGGEAGVGYLWDAALRKGLSVRNYGFYGDGVRYSLPASNPAFIPVVRNPFELGAVQFFPAKASLMGISDPYFRGYDQKNADFWLVKEWEREFDLYVQNRNLPALQLVRLPHDHFGDFASAIDRVNTPDTQMADNDYAVGRLVEKVARSRYRNNTLIFVVEDDAQNGGDHVDAHRSIAYVVGPFVKQRRVVSTPYDTVSMVRTIVDVLGLEPLGLPDGLASPMANVFERRSRPRPWSHTAIVPEVLRNTDLPLPPPASQAASRPVAQPRGNAAYWARAMSEQNFTREDDLDSDAFNRALWHGLMGATAPYPTDRHGRDLSNDRQRLLRATSGQ